MDDDTICAICNKTLSRKQRLTSHLKVVHGVDEKTPVYKRYKIDPSIPVPRTTQFNHRVKNVRKDDEPNTSKNEDETETLLSETGLKLMHSGDKETPVYKRYEHDTSVPVPRTTQYNHRVMKDGEPNSSENDEMQTAGLLLHVSESILHVASDTENVDCVHKMNPGNDYTRHITTDGNNSHPNCTSVCENIEIEDRVQMPETNIQNDNFNSQLTNHQTPEMNDNIRFSDLQDIDTTLNPEYNDNRTEMFENDQIGDGDVIQSIEMNSTPEMNDNIRFSDLQDIDTTLDPEYNDNRTEMFENDQIGDGDVIQSIEMNSTPEMNDNIRFSDLQDIDTTLDPEYNDNRTEMFENDQIGDGDVIQSIEMNSTSDSELDNQDDMHSTTTQSSDSDSESLSDLSDDSHKETVEVKKMTKNEEVYRSILALSSRHCLNGEATDHLVKLIGILTSENSKTFSTTKMNECMGDFVVKHYDYCSECNTLFPTDETVVQCSLNGCKGFRYKGGESQQHKKQKNHFFVTCDIHDGIKSILEKEGVWQALIKYREDCEQSRAITDMINGEMYKELRSEGQILNNNNNISLLFNTDGVPLYNSSKVSIWPVYLIINELPPKMRFARQNMILWGVWQSKGKPCFRTFFEPFVDDMISLKENGLMISVNETQENIKAVLLAGTLDLQAKAMLLDMMHHNGENACITCEEPGVVVPRGRGHARVFPCRETDARLRESEEVLQCGLQAGTKHVKGIKGVSPLFGLNWFDVVWGIVPDYMHGVLLGVTKKMLSLMLTSSNSRQPYYIGKHITDIDRLLMSMKPTDEIPRLPRCLEQHFHQLKASELQTWLIYYAIPCLKDTLPTQYLDHLALMVEGIYILLGDSISSTYLQRADNVLKTFYKEFETLYGASNVTINLHNMGQHLTEYVKRLGPLWAWSCFAFEDMNGSLLAHLHGTGNVCQQILWTLHVQKRIAIDAGNITSPQLKEYTQMMVNNSRQVKVKKIAQNCKIAGAMTLIAPDDAISMKLKETLNVQHLGPVFKVLRIVKGDQVICSCHYTRMEKRISYAAIADVGDDKEAIVSIQYFVYHQNTNKCVAVVKMIDSNGLVHPSVHHLRQVNANLDQNEEIVLTVGTLSEKVLFLTGNSQFPCIVRVPNRYGQCS